jgi:hypothetical protein
VGSATTPLRDELPELCALTLVTQTAKHNIVSKPPLTNLREHFVRTFCFNIASSPISLAPSLPSPEKFARHDKRKSRKNSHAWINASRGRDDTFLIWRLD